MQQQMNKEQNANCFLQAADSTYSSLPTVSSGRNAPYCCNTFWIYNLIGLHVYTVYVYYIFYHDYLHSLNLADVEVPPTIKKASRKKDKDKVKEEKKKEKKKLKKEMKRSKQMGTEGGEPPSSAGPASGVSTSEQQQQQQESRETDSAQQHQLPQDEGEMGNGAEEGTILMSYTFLNLIVLIDLLSCVHGCFVYIWAFF